ncbi:MAG: hypothetical protein RBT63_05305 [Bdellovibrionales bacterium]|jgi:hypothetical protein|nr:hypothetical protein [Bdellovibrionales bacterium]
MNTIRLAKATCFILVTLSSLISSAASPPDQRTVDAWLNLTLSTPDQAIHESEDGPWFCRHLHPVSSSEGTAGIKHASRGKSREAAYSKAAIKCIKNQCERISELLSEAHEELTRIDDAELGLVMKGLGYDKETIARALERRKAPTQTNSTTCSDGPPLLRTFVVDFCFAIPFECIEN